MAGQKAALDAVSFQSYEDFEHIGNDYYTSLLDRGTEGRKARGYKETATFNTDHLSALRQSRRKVANSSLYNGVIQALTALNGLMDTPISEREKQEKLGNALAAYGAVLKSCEDYIEARNPRTRMGKERMELVRRVYQDTQREVLLLQMRMFDVGDFRAGITVRQLLAGEMPLNEVRSQAGFFHMDEQEQEALGEDHQQWQLPMSVSEFRTQAADEGRLSINAIARMALCMEVYNRTLREGDKGDPDGYYMKYLPAYLVAMIRQCDEHTDSPLMQTLRQNFAAKPIPDEAYQDKLGEMKRVTGVHSMSEVNAAQLADITEWKDQFREYQPMSYQEMKALSAANPFNTDVSKAREIYNQKALGSDADASYVGTDTAMRINEYARSQKFSDLNHLAAHHAMGVLDRAAESCRLTRKARFHRLVGGAFLQYALGMEDAYENLQMAENVDKEINKRAGTVVTDAGYMSVGYRVDTMFGGSPIMLTLLCDEGTPFLPTENHGESELIFPRNTSYMILGARSYTRQNGPQFAQTTMYTLNTPEDRKEELERGPQSAARYEGVEIFCKVVSKEVSSGRGADAQQYQEFLEAQKSYEGHFGGHGDFVHRNAYLKMADHDKATLTEGQRWAMQAYTTTSDEINKRLRSGEQKDDEVQRQIEEMAGAFDTHVLPMDMVTYRGVDDGMLLYLLGNEQFGITPEEREMCMTDGRIDYQKMEQTGGYKAFEGLVFEDKAYVSTSTNRYFAKRWANQVAHRAYADRLEKQGNVDEANRIRQDFVTHDENISGSHVFVMHLKAGTKAMFVDTMYVNPRTGMSRGQDELTLAAGYRYRIRSVRRDASAGAGAYMFDIDVII